MSLRRDLALLIHHTAAAVRQQTEQGMETVWLPAPLETALTLPEKRLSGASTAGPAATLDDLYARHNGCVLCQLSEKRQRFVFGSGNPDADVMFIGEAPGAEEDTRGEPFVGAAGELLTRILKAIGFNREEVYIANIIKCRPPGNRNPEPDEIETCRPILEDQIRLVKPRLICALGRFAGQALTGNAASLNRLRGRFYDYRGIPTLVTYHPAALLRNEAFKRPTWEDVKMLRREYDRLIESRKSSSEE